MLNDVYISPKFERITTVASSFEFFLKIGDVFFVYIIFFGKFLLINLSKAFFRTQTLFLNIYFQQNKGLMFE